MSFCSHEQVGWSLQLLFVNHLLGGNLTLQKEKTLEMKYYFATLGQSRWSLVVQCCQWITSSLCSWSTCRSITSTIAMSMRHPNSTVVTLGNPLSNVFRDDTIFWPWEEGFSDAVLTVLPLNRPGVNPSKIDRHIKILVTVFSLSETFRLSCIQDRTQPRDCHGASHALRPKVAPK